MNPLKSLPLSPDERAILKKVFFISMGACVLIVGIAWGIRAVRVAAAGESARRVATAHNDPIDQLINHQGLLPIDVAAHRIAAAHFERTQEPAKAIQHLLRTLAVDGRDRVARLQLATAYLNAGDYPKATEEFTLLLDDNAEDSIGHIAEARICLSLFYREQYTNAAERLDRLLERSPSSHEALCYRGQIQAALDPRSPEILAYFQRALAANPSYTEAGYQRARYLMNKPDASTEDYHRARLDLLALLDQEPLNAKVHSRLGMIYYYLGQYDAAKSSYRTALALNPRDCNTHYNLGETYYMGLNDPVEAVKHYKAALAIDDSHVEANFKLGLIALANDATHEAVVHFRKAVDGEPTNIRFQLQLAVAYEREGLTDRAVETYRSILARDPLHAVARQKLMLLRPAGT